MAFSDSEKDRVLHFLSYPSWSQVVQSIQLGYPAASQPLFLVYQAFTNITDGGEDSVRADLCACERIEAQLLDATSRMKASKLGMLELNPQETRMLRQELTFWVRRLADDLGVVPNPFSQIQFEGYGGSMNAKVRG
jgi:hypothetical protein